ncbi:hypothetical protein Efla_002440 [Eimeria flavescens]
MQVIDSPGRTWQSEGSSELGEDQLHWPPRTPETGRKPGVSVRHQSLKDKRLRVAAVLVVVYILVALVVTIMCRKTLYTLTKAGSSQRGLAGTGGAKESDDEELDNILRECVEMELESGRLPFILGTQETNNLEPAAKKARLIDVIRSTVSSFEAAGHPPSIASGWRSSKPIVAHSNLLQSELSYIVGHHIDAVPWTPSEDTDTSGSISTKTDGRSMERPAFSQESWLDKVPALAADGGGAEVDTKEPNAQEDPYEDEGGSTVPCALSNLQNIRALRSSETYLKDHPFVRLPKIVPGAIQRDFRTELPPSKAMPWKSASGLLLVFRELFAKPVLGTKDAEELMCASETLVRYACTRLGGIALARAVLNVRVRQLGLSFLILDAIVCARQLLGEHMRVEQWWSDFTLHFFTDYRPAGQPLTSRQMSWHNYRLEMALRQAIKLLKTGVRPKNSDIIYLKRKLLASQHVLSYFELPKWNAWREDDCAFRVALGSFPCILTPALHAAVSEKRRMAAFDHSTSQTRE